MSNERDDTDTDKRQINTERRTNREIQRNEQSDKHKEKKNGIK